MTLICSLCFTSIQCLAYDSLNQNQGVSLTVTFKNETKAFSGVHFKIYKVANIDESVHFTLIDPFTKYSVEVNDLESEEWRELAETLDGYVIKDDIPCTSEGDTDENGQVVFSDLTQGLYLVSSAVYQDENTKYTSQAFLVSLPNVVNDAWVYDVQSECKYDSEEITKKTTSITAMKIWKDEGNKTERPASITVELYQDDTLYDTQILNSDDNWEYTWESLDAQHQYHVVEKEVPSKYTVKTNRVDNTYEIINTYKTPTPTPTPTTPSTGKKEEIPNTGVLWWPVPVLAGCGTLLYMIGWYRNRNEA